MQNGTTETFMERHSTSVKSCDQKLRNKFHGVIRKLPHTEWDLTFDASGILFYT